MIYWYKLILITINLELVMDIKLFSKMLKDKHFCNLEKMKYKYSGDFAEFLQTLSELYYKDLPILISTETTLFSSKIMRRSVRMRSNCFWKTRTIITVSKQPKMKLWLLLLLKTLISAVTACVIFLKAMHRKTIRKAEFLVSKGIGIYCRYFQQNHRRKFAQALYDDSRRFPWRRWQAEWRWILPSRYHFYCRKSNWAYGC